MALTIWRGGRKGNTYQFVDRKMSAFFKMSGTVALIHKYLGSYDSNGNPTDVTTIQDVLLLENRDRRYSSEIYELMSLYNINDIDFDLRQFGLFLSNDTLFLEFHLNDTVDALGRKLMNGDVIELLHQRDENLLTPEAPAINKFYVVEDVNRSASGYSPADWFPHVLRVKMSPITDSQEYASILDQKAKNPLGLNTPNTLRDIMSSVGIEMGIDESIVAQAALDVPARNFQTEQFYVIPGDELTGQLPWVFAGDGIPPNGAVLSGSGTVFPYPATEGEYYLRVDYEPSTLFRYTNGVWIIQEQDYRGSAWSAASRILLSFVNNTNVSTFEDGLTQPEKQPLYQAVKPRADF